MSDFEDIEEICDFCQTPGDGTYACAECGQEICSSCEPDLGLCQWCYDTRDE